MRNLIDMTTQDNVRMLRTSYRAMIVERIKRIISITIIIFIDTQIPVPIKHIQHSRVSRLDCAVLYIDKAAWVVQSVADSIAADCT